MIGLGTWGLSGESYGKLSVKLAKKIILNCIKKKINFIDTATTYGKGRVESIIGNLVKKKTIKRRNIIICSKFGMLPHKGIKPIQNFNTDFLKKEVNKMLKRLCTNYLDVILLHSPPREVLQDKKVFNFLNEIKKQKIVKNIGVSLKSPQDIFYIKSSYQVDYLEFNFNLMDQRILNLNFLNKVKKYKIKTICRTPLAFGFLTNSGINIKKLQKGDHRLYWPKYQIDAWNIGRKLFFPFRDKYHFKDLSDLALSFCLSHKFNYVIPGMYSLNDLNKNIKIINKKIKKKDLSEINEIYLKNQNKFYIKK